MAAQSDRKELVLRLDLEDLRRGAEAREKMLRAAENKEEKPAERTISRTQNLQQALTGKGILLDFRA